MLANSIALALVYLLKNKFHFRVKYIFIISVLFNIVAIICTSYAGIIEDKFIWTFVESYLSIFNTFKNGLFFGFVYVALGTLIQEYKCETRFTKKRWLTLVVGCFILVIVESVFTEYLNLNSHGVDIKLSLIPFTFCIICGLLTFPNTHFDSSIGKHFRKLSTLIFLTQRIFLTIFSYLKYDIKLATVFWFLIVMSCTILISEAIFYLSDRFNKLKLIY